MRRFARLVAAGALALAAVFAGPASLAAADVDDFEFASMDADYTLTRGADGEAELHVVETYVPVFPETDQNRGMRRFIPLTYLGAPLDPVVTSVTDEDGRPRPFETDEDDGFLVITSRADDYLHGPQTYVFEYTIHNVTRYFADGDVDEFYWDVNGVDSAQPYGRVSAQLHLDAELADALTGERACYAGTQGSTGTSCSIEQIDRAGSVTIVAETTTALAPRETLTIAVGFTAGTFTTFDSSYYASPWGWVQTIAALGLLAAVVWTIVWRIRVLKDAPGYPTVIAQYEPPSTVDALHAAVLLGRTAKAIPAELLEQAVGGSIRMVEVPKRWGRPALEAELIDRSRADENGRDLIDGLFGADAAPGAVFTFGRQSTRLTAAVRVILRDARKNLVARGLRADIPARRRYLPLSLAIVSALAVVGSGMLALGDNVDSLALALLTIGAIPVLLVVWSILGRAVLTEKGARTRDHLRGLKIFIDWAEADRIRMLQSPQGAERVRIDPTDPRQLVELYEVLLPYAVVFGQEKKWAERLAVLYDETDTPTWYAGMAAFTASSFASSISSVTASATNISSTSSGSSGGGSAGGGGGGGGAGGV